ncbi:MAG TPA: antibiotic biosynthesis monooxygenase [Motilibacteraceae bacterium]|nr:antibiotic biosynthesis monooxygenase [Motilibacteraceae bacterium]
MTHPAAPPSATAKDIAATGSFVSVSHVTVDVGGETGESAAQVLERAFAHRLGEVEGENGFQRLEVWRDVKVAGTYVMVTWWDTEEDFRAYLRSEAHDRSHARVPTSPARPRGAGLDRYQVVAR